MKIAKQKKIKSSEDGLLVKNILAKQMGFSRREIGHMCLVQFTSMIKSVD